MSLGLLHIEKADARELIAFKQAAAQELLFDLTNLHRLHAAAVGCKLACGQLAHLLAAAELPQVDLRVLPASVGAHACLSGDFLVFTIAEPDLDVGYTDTTGGGVYVEPPDSERFVRVYDRLLNSALEPAESAKLIRAIGEDL